MHNCSPFSMEIKRALGEPSALLCISVLKSRGL